MGSPVRPKVHETWWHRRSQEARVVERVTKTKVTMVEPIMLLVYDHTHEAFHRAYRRATSEEMGVVWCVRHREGWCAVRGNKQPSDDENNVPTLCGFFVTMPFGIECRVPDCKECRP